MTRNRQFPKDLSAGKPVKPPQKDKVRRKQKGSTLNNQSTGEPEEAISPTSKPKRLTLPGNWMVWAMLLVLVSGSVGFVAVALLLKLPSVPNCPATFWPTASASMRLYCAQLAANKQTAENYLEAIALVENLPLDHPLRAEIDRNIEQWSEAILKMGEDKFQAGNLTEAIAIAQKIPTRVSAYKLVQARIEKWQSIWAKAEAINQQIETLLRQSKWNLAFREAVKLTDLGNNYWATTKYDELVKQIQIAKESTRQLDKAYQLSKTSNVDNLLQAVELAGQIPQNSYAYKEAQDLILATGDKLLSIAQTRLDNQDWQGVLYIANRMPASVKLKPQTQDLANLANAQSSAALGTVEGLETAIASAQKLEQSRPLYDKAQELIARWQREIEDVAHLQKARSLAQSGGINDLVNAIAEAQLVPSGNPRYSESQRQIKTWTSQVQALEDKPYLDRALKVASLGSVAAFSEAIEEASFISPGRALYGEAQSKIRQWTLAIQRLQDQPYLDQAVALANAGNLSGAVATAQQIKQGRALYTEAANKVRSWQIDIQGQNRLQEANNAATPGTPEAIANAIRLARQVPGSTRWRVEANQSLNRWSYQLLAIAQERSASNLVTAIEVAKLIPSDTAAYNDAQRQIQTWQKILEPPAVTYPSSDVPDDNG